MTTVELKITDLETNKTITETIKVDSAEELDQYLKGYSKCFIEVKLDKNK